MEEWRVAIREQNELVRQANHMKESALAMEPTTNELRSQFILALGTDATKAEAVGSITVACVTQLEGLWTGAATKLSDGLAKVMAVTEV